MKNILIALIILIGFDQASALKKILKLKIEKKNPALSRRLL